MKAISLHQPWASLIASGDKTIETRWWRTHYRGDLLICSTKKPMFRDMPCGFALAIVDVYDCVPFDEEHARDAGFDTRRMLGTLNYQWLHDKTCWSWMLEDIRRLEEPFKVVGRQRIFNVNKPIIILSGDVTKLE